MIVSRVELLRLREEWRTTRARVVFTNGCFDLIHLGHVHYLQQARALGDLLVLGLNSDSSVQQLKGPLRPLVAEDERALVVAALRPVDYVIIFEEPTAETLVAELQPNIYVKGGDYSADSGEGKPLPEAEIVRRYGGEVVLIPFLPGHSTSDLIVKIMNTFSN
ncbi:MAG: D-glycero-beta-D-manno-heptose 1-phosphate adenylyltransferase [Chloroflexota bacterium]|nr:D-glycero-beta-D-manno-heptose 1-phosphate adenylyltransferase [Chloroflexota bacterium]